MDDHNDTFVPVEPDRLARSRKRQIRAWRRAVRKMKWPIWPEEFNTIPRPPLSSPTADNRKAYTLDTLCYGFGDSTAVDPLASGLEPWRFARKRWFQRTWQCRYIHFDRPDHIRLRPGAPMRPIGFYWARIHIPYGPVQTTVARFRKTLDGDYTGCGPEGIQMLCITHPHLARLMNRGRLPFLAFADYDVAPYGHADYFDAIQMFCSVDTLGMGIGNVDRDYPKFAIPSLQLR